MGIGDGNGRILPHSGRTYHMAASIPDVFPFFRNTQAADTGTYQFDIEQIVSGTYLLEAEPEKDLGNGLIQKISPGIRK